MVPVVQNRTLDATTGQYVRRNSGDLEVWVYFKDGTDVSSSQVVKVIGGGVFDMQGDPLMPTPPSLIAALAAMNAEVESLVDTLASTALVVPT